MRSRPAPAPSTSVKTLALADWVGKAVALASTMAKSNVIGRSCGRARSRRRIEGTATTAPAAAAAAAAAAPRVRRRVSHADAGAAACGVARFERGSAGAVSPVGRPRR